MQFRKLVLLFCVSLGMLSISCRDTDVKKDLNSQEDGTREINTTELEGIDRRETLDTLDVDDRRSKNPDSIYRENDMHLEQSNNLDENSE